MPSQARSAALRLPFKKVVLFPRPPKRKNRVRACVRVTEPLPFLHCAGGHTTASLFLRGFLIVWCFFRLRSSILCCLRLALCSGRAARSSTAGRSAGRDVFVWQHRRDNTGDQHHSLSSHTNHQPPTHHSVRRPLTPHTTLGTRSQQHAKDNKQRTASKHSLGHTTNKQQASTTQQSTNRRATSQTTIAVNNTLSHSLR